MKTLLVVGTAAFGLCLVAAVVSAQEEQSPRDLAALQKHIVEKDYPELFGSTAYRTKIEKILNVDLDRDGDRELVVLFAPHYRQSAPIVIYRLSKTLEVTRVKEGLAPGPLVPLSGAYLDSHSLGQGVDFTLNAKDGPIDREKTLKGLFQSKFGGIVEYRSFFHADGRTGEPAYVDMRHVDVPRGKMNCEEFEFSHVDGIAAGALQADPTKVYLVARVGPELWLYHISEFLPSGLLRKEAHVEKLPVDFVRFAPGTNPILLYETSSRAVQPLRFPPH